MGAKIKAIFVVLILSLVFLHSKSISLAAPTNCSAVSNGFSTTTTAWPTNPSRTGSYAPATLTMNLGSGYPDGNYKVICANDPTFSSPYVGHDEIIVASANKILTATFSSNNCFQFVSQNSSENGDLAMYVKIEQVDTSRTPPSTIGTVCTAQTYTLKNYSSGIDCSSATFNFAVGGLSGCFAINDQYTWSLSNLKNSDGTPVNGSFRLKVDNSGVDTSIAVANGGASGTGTVTGAAGSYLKANIYLPGSSSQGCAYQTPSTIKNACTPEDRAGTGVDPGNGGNGATGNVPYTLCSQAADAPTPTKPAGGPEYQACTSCVGNKDDLTDPSSQGYWTAFGCVSVTKEGIVTSLLRIGIGLSGGFVLLSILYGAFLLTTSSGDPTRVKEGQEMITSAIMGLLFVIFSIIILQFIGVTLLKIPGFGT